MAPSTPASVRTDAITVIRAGCWHTTRSHSAGRGVRHVTGQRSVVHLAEWGWADSRQCWKYLCRNGRGAVRCRYGRTGLRFQCAEADADIEWTGFDRLLHTIQPGDALPDGSGPEF